MPSSKISAVFLLLLAPFVALTSVFASSPAASASAPSSPSVSSAATATPSSEATAKPKATEQKPGISRDVVIPFLNSAIGWYHHLDTEEAVATQPAEMLYVANDRDMAQKVLKFAFEFAHAEAALIQATAPTAVASTQSGTSALVNGVPVNLVPDLSVRLAQIQAQVQAAQSQISSLQAQLQTSTGAQRDTLTKEIAAAQSQLNLLQLRRDSMQALSDFEKGAGGEGAAGGGLEAQIAELERSVPQPLQTKAQPSAAVSPPVQEQPLQASGIIGHAENLLMLTRKQQTLSNAADQTRSLNNWVNKLRAPLVASLQQINAQASTLASQLNDGNPAELEQIKTHLDQITNLYKLNISALMPLTQMSGVLEMYSANLDRWRKMVSRQTAADVRGLVIGLSGLAIIIALVTIGSILWRRILFRYVRDRQRRQQLLQVRRIVVTLIIALVLMFDFANQFGALATILGFAAAGIALALQNVIMSMAGYLYVSGRYGIRVGDRIQISDISGDVLEIGLFKLTMLELSGGANGQQPTGRVIIFPNSVVFQTTGNFYRQVPGTNFTWNELKITLAPDCDFGLIEKRLLEIVGQVYGRYRDSIHREYVYMETDLNIRAEEPKPMCRLQVGEAAIELICRYPVRIESTAETQDEVARRLLEVLGHEPTLKLNVQGTPSVSRATPPATESVPKSNVGPVSSS